MYDIKTDNVKKEKRFFYPFFIIGVVVLIVLLVFIIMNIVKSKSLDSTTMSTSVEIISHVDDEGNTMYSPTYYYTVKGENYACESNFSSSSRPSNSNKIVYYDSKDPSKCMTEYSKSGNKIFLIFLVLPIAFITLGIINIKKVNKRIKTINELNKTGKLVKNLPYRLEDSNFKVNNVTIQKPVIDYTLPNGVTVTLHGDTRFDRKVFDADGMVDLVIDENHPENYFLDFEINRLTGNLPTDYYKGNINNIINTNQNIMNQNNISQSNISQSNIIQNNTTYNDITQNVSNQNTEINNNINEINNTKDNNIQNNMLQ